MGNTICCEETEKPSPTQWQWCLHVKGKSVFGFQEEVVEANHSPQEVVETITRDDEGSEAEEPTGEMEEITDWEDFEEASCQEDDSSRQVSPDLSSLSTMSALTDLDWEESAEPMTVVTFWDPKSESQHGVAFRSSPMGLQLSSKGHGPAQVCKVHQGYEADMLGVKEGMEVLAVNGTDVRECDSLEVVEMIRRCCELLPLTTSDLPSADLLLVEPEVGKKSAIRFLRCEFGLQFLEGQVPVVIAGVAANTEAEALGVKKGMQIVAVNGKDVSALDFREVRKEIQESCLQLLPAASL